MTPAKNILLAFFGDDFTGSTDALESVSCMGAKAVLFIEPPTVEKLEKYPQAQVVGVAGLTRSMPPAQMAEILEPAFRSLLKLAPRHIHYKVCSTFDSSPAIGSIGKAIDTGMNVFQSSFVPLLVAAPGLGRFTVFGNHFARMGTQPSAEVYRLDRHPSMRKHPVTPATESDLRIHLGRQTRKLIGLIDIQAVSAGITQISQSLQHNLVEGKEIILLDALEESQLLPIGQCLDTWAKNNNGPLFSVGSSGIESALGACWQQAGELPSAMSWPNPGKATPLLVISGSCSPVTGRQIARAKQIGFEEIIATPDTCLPGNAAMLEQLVKRALVAMQHDKSVIIHTNGTQETATREISAEHLGTMLGKAVLQIAMQFDLRRLVVAGGDTSSYAARAMGIEAVEMIAPIVKGAPLCRVVAPGSPVDQKEISFKGGQVGDEYFFEHLLLGTTK